MLREIEETRHIFVGGKGGVGKTTIASSIAVTLAEGGKRVLIFSTDPVRALADTLETVVADNVTAVKGVRNLFALQSNPQKLLEEYMQRHRQVLVRIVEEGTYFDREDVEQFLHLSLPGLDELMAIMKIMEMQREREFDHYVIDTAPTGHVIRLLQLPSMMENMLRALSKMRAKSAYVKAVLVGRRVKDEADSFLEKEMDDVKTLRRLLTDSKLTQFVPALIPEGMAVEETHDLLTELTRLGFHIKNLIVNNVIPETGCEACSTRRREQLRYIREIKRAYPEYQVTEVPLFTYPVKGHRRLLEFGEYLFSTRTMTKYARAKGKRSSIAVKRSNILDLVDGDRGLLIFGGKGGVGKTTCASATALTLAEERRVMIFSTDPAHSLSDSFSSQIGNKVTCLTGHLHALEVNAEELLEELKNHYRREINEVFESFLGRPRSQGIQLDVAFDREIMADLFSLAPPGLDEIMALKKIMDLRKEGRYDTFILDTAPTTHALRLLEMPDLAKQWLDAFNNLQYKYSGIISLEKTTMLLESLRSDVENIQQSLTDPEETEFVVVTIPEAVPVRETERLVERLASMEISTKHMIVNRVVPPSSCEYCKAREIEQQKHLRQIRSKFADFKIREMPQFNSEVKGIGDLRRYANVLYARKDGVVDLS